MVDVTETTTTHSGREQRLRMYSWGLIVAFVIAAIVPALQAVGAEAPAEIAGGDYPAFYGAGSIAAEGDWDDLYSFSAQVEAQAGLNEGEGSAWYFAYPPPVALPYIPLSQLPYLPSLMIHTVIMAALMIGTVLLARPMIPWIRGREVTALAGILLFLPVLRGVSGGSNTALTMFLLVSVWRLARDGRDLAAGLTLAALLYKPQYGLAPAGLFLLDRRPRLTAAFGAGLAVFYLIASVLLGPGWLGEWLEIAGEFEKLDLEVNGQSASSLVAFSQNLLGIHDPVALVVGYGLTAVVIVGLMVLWWRRTPASLDHRYALTIPGLLLLSPHTMSHDVGIVLIAVGYLVGVAGRRAVPWVVGVYVLGFAQAAMGVLGFSPGFFTLLLVTTWAVRELLVDTSRSAVSTAA